MIWKIEIRKASSTSLNKWRTFRAVDYWVNGEKIGTSLEQVRSRIPLSVPRATVNMACKMARERGTAEIELKNGKAVVRF